MVVGAPVDVRRFECLRLGFGMNLFLTCPSRYVVMRSVRGFATRPNGRPEPSPGSHTLSDSGSVRRPGKYPGNPLYKSSAWAAPAESARAGRPPTRARRPGKNRFRCPPSSGLPLRVRPSLDWSVIKVELQIQRVAGHFQAPVALGFHLHGYMALNPYLTLVLVSNSALPSVRRGRPDAVACRETVSSRLEGSLQSRPSATPSRVCSRTWRVLRGCGLKSTLHYSGSGAGRETP